MKAANVSAKHSVDAFEQDQAIECWVGEDECIAGTGRRHMVRGCEYGVVCRRGPIGYGDGRVDERFRPFGFGHVGRISVDAQVLCSISRISGKSIVLCKNGHIQGRTAQQLLGKSRS